MEQLGLGLFQVLDQLLLSQIKAETSGLPVIQPFNERLFLLRQDLVKHHHRGKLKERLQSL
jgi:hypothetical protein